MVWLISSVIFLANCCTIHDNVITIYLKIYIENFFWFFKFLATFMNESEHCECPVPCEKTRYQSQLSYAQIPAKYYSETLAKLKHVDKDIMRHFLRWVYLCVYCIFVRQKCKGWNRVVKYRYIVKCISRVRQPVWRRRVESRASTEC